ncbi:beta-galactosidase [Asticcacaulis sp. 201]|uniref:glycoside hydrolase family 35 protein n=1 Tax=Asticcacaulis sp. 201 TaxID=3028787 RepID=UPI0029160FFA|nr:beta-galactosidase [Asticcacaulis sp. 201]MDV6332055.1 beta-galactosidase [Asticcacaulis sp. 201]
MDSNHLNRRGFVASVAAMGASLAVFGAASASAVKPRFTVEGDQFMLDGKPFQILAGEMHYPRIPREYWRDRLRKLKALGLNTLTTYVFWNVHETAPGVYDFSGNLDIAAYVRMAHEEGLWVNLRPGPYVCAEWDGGGLPAWLFPEETGIARTSDPKFIEPMKRWFKRLGQELTPLLIDSGGPIILTQVENEYGAFGADHAYMAEVMQAERDAGFSGLLYTADPSQFIANGSIPGVVAGINFGTNYKAEEEFAARAKVRPDGPFFNSELWGGWFDAFGDLHATMEIPPLIASLKWMLDHKMSISFYMLHGGTSFAWYAGANWDNKGYAADISSYDYDAILDEAGRPTPKYEAVSALLKNYLPASAFSPLPEPEIPAIIPRFRLKQAAPLDQLLLKSTLQKTPKSLDALGQMHGLMLYRYQAKVAAKGELKFGDVRDYALVRINGKTVATLDRRLKETSVSVDLPKGAVLDVLVDTHGHCNYGKNIGRDQKGLIGGVTLNGTPLEGWAQYGLPMDSPTGLTFSAQAPDGPAFYRGTFSVEKPGFTFLDMRGWGKGYVFVNGHNLGRHWSVGPQRAMFVPGPWLKAGENEVVVLDLHESAERTLAGGANEIWDLPGLVKA